MAESKWEIHSTEEIKGYEELAKETGFTPPVVKILMQRGFTTSQAIRGFLKGTLSETHDPFLLKGMREAVCRIHQAVDQNEIILIHGDYDVDGVTSTALLGKVLDRLGAQYHQYLPERLKGGYGVSKKAIHFAKSKGVKLIITVDCGISAYEEIDMANGFGIDVIVTDHHQPAGEEPPTAVAVIDPWQADCPYPFKELSGVGVAYKLACALGVPPQEAHLDLVAFGTVCDLCTLVNENRILVKYGLKEMEGETNCGLSALKKVAKVRGKKVTTGHLGFMLGPRVNASGRLGSADYALRLLMTPDKREAAELANALDEGNKERRKLEQLILAEALKRTESEIDFTTEKIIVVWNTNWHLGVVGIVAQRLVEKYHCPAIVISVDRTTKLARGSARSVRGFNLFDALTASKEFLLEFGGHEYAAGIEIEEEKLEEFRKFINIYVSRAMKGQPFVHTFNVDLELCFSEITPKFVDDLEALEPYGRGNMKPIFMTRNLVCKGRSFFMGRSTVKVGLTDGQSTYEGVWYKAPEDTRFLEGDKVDIIYTLSVKFWDGIKTVTLEIKEIKRR